MFWLFGRKPGGQVKPHDHILDSDPTIPLGSIRVTPMIDQRWRIQHKRQRTESGYVYFRTLRDWKPLEVPGNDRGFATKEEALTAYREWKAFLAQSLEIMYTPPEGSPDGS